MGFDSLWHWIIVLVIVIVLFGTKKIRNLGPDLGAAIRDFKKSLSGDDEAKQKEEEAARKAEEERQRATEGRTAHDNGSETPVYGQMRTNLGPPQMGGPQLPPIGYQPAAGGPTAPQYGRSEERRVGKECSS